MDNGLTVFLCSSFFVFLVLIKQNVLLFVTSNINPNIQYTPIHRLFRAYDLDRNGIIDIEEFHNIAERLMRDTHVETVREPDIGVEYLDLKAEFSGVELGNSVCDSNQACLESCSVLEPVNSTVTLTAASFDLLKPSQVRVGYSWVLHTGRINDYSDYFTYPVKPYHKHYILYQLLSLFQRNVMFDLRKAPAVSVAIVTGLSDTHVRVNFVVRAEYQIGQPLAPRVWLKPDSFSGEIVFSVDYKSISFFNLSCSEFLEVEWLGDSAILPKRVVIGEMQIRSTKASYKYHIKHNSLVAVPSPALQSDSWYKSLPEWRKVLEDKYYSTKKKKI